MALLLVRRAAAAARVARPRRRAASTWRAPRCRWSRCWRRSTASSSSRSTASRSTPVLAIAAGLAVGAAFVRRQRRLADPLIDLRLFRAPAFSAALAVEHAGRLRDPRHRAVHRAVPAARARPVAAGGGAVDAALVGRVHRRLDARARCSRSGSAPGDVIAGGLALAAAAACRAHPASARLGGRWSTGSALLSRSALAPVVTLSTDADRRRRAAGARRRGVGALGDRAPSSAARSASRCSAASAPRSTTATSVPGSTSRRCSAPR